MLLSHEMDIAILDMVDYALAILELALKHLDSITNLNLKLRIISNSFHEGIVVEKIPLILILVLKLIKMRLGCRVDLEHFDLL